ncbi:MAG: folate-binding protein YgfZ [Austwickia sp.]|nr:folate-binding protein YgfZ [Austwickia sp.]
MSGLTTGPQQSPIPASPALSRIGAVPGEGVDAAVASHYGDPVREQRLLVEGLASVDLSHRGVVTVTGPDRLRWLHSMTTQHLSELAPGQSTEALVLSPKGHIEHALHVVDDGATTWLTVEPGSAPALVTWLDSMRFMLDVQVADRTQEYAVIGEPVGRPGADGEPPTWVDSWPTLGPDTAAYAGADPHPGAGRAWREVLVPRTALAAQLEGRELAGMWAAEALRVAAWRPRLGFETDHRTLVHEVDWLRTAVHLHKGCYRGQETVARVHNLGRPPRRLVFLHLDGSGHVLPQVGSSVVREDRPIGQLTSVARHQELGPIALAIIKRSVPVADVLTVISDGGSIAAAPTVIVDP